MYIGTARRIANRKKQKKKDRFSFHFFSTTEIATHTYTLNCKKRDRLIITLVKKDTLLERGFLPGLTAFCIIYYFQLIILQLQYILFISSVTLLYTFCLTVAQSPSRPFRKYTELVATHLYLCKSITRHLFLHFSVLYSSTPHEPMNLSYCIQQELNSLKELQQCFILNSFGITAVHKKLQTWVT